MVARDAGCDLKAAQRRADDAREEGEHGHEVLRAAIEDVEGPEPRECDELEQEGERPAAAQREVERCEVRGVSEEVVPVGVCWVVCMLADEVELQEHQLL